MLCVCYPIHLHGMALRHEHIYMTTYKLYEYQSPDSSGGTGIHCWLHSGFFYLQVRYFLFTVVCGLALGTCCEADSPFISFG